MPVDNVRVESSIAVDGKTLSEDQRAIAQASFDQALELLRRS